MRAKVLKVLQGYKPLTYWKGRLLLSRGFELFLADTELNSVTFFAKLPGSYLLGFLARIRLVSRLFRLDIGPACVVDDGIHCIVCHQGVLYKINMESGGIEKEFVLPSGRHPLQFTQVDVIGFSPGIYFGEYLANPEKNAVCIYHRDVSGEWRIAYEFVAGMVNHIHRIVQDMERKCLYVLTGDFGDAAAIWQVTSSFSQIIRIVGPGQDARACWMKVSKDHLVYATDSQLEENSVNCIDVSEGGFSKPKHIQKIFGSSIYCSELTTCGFLFSTAVEPDEIQGNKFLAMFSKRPGPGIVSEDAHIYFGCDHLNIFSVFSAAKDFYPFRLFQFGSFSFPSGSTGDNKFIHVYGIAVEHYDGATVLLELPPSVPLN